MTDTEMDQARARALYQQGMTLLQNGQRTEAVSLLDTAAATAPSAEYLNDLAVAYLQNGQYGQAQIILQQAIEKFPGAQEPRFNLAKLLAMKNQTNAALQLLHCIPDAEMKADGWVCRGMVFYKMGQRSEAIRNFEAARRMRPKGLPVRHMLAKCYNEEKRWADTLRVLGEAEQIATENPGAHLSPQHYLMLGLATRSMQMPEKAIAAFEAALRMDPENDVADEMLGHLFGQLFKPDKSLEHYNRVSARNPGNARYHTEASQVLIMLQRYDEALARLKTALKITPDDFDAQRHTGDALINAGRIEEAEASFRQLTDKFPDKPDAWISRGDAALVSGKAEEAEEYYFKALDLNPHIVVLYRRLMDLGRKITPEDPLLAQISAELARPGLRDTDLADLHIAMARALGQLGRHAEAMTHLDQGNACKRRTVSYNEPAILSTMTRMQEAFQKPLSLTPQTVKRPGPRLVFVVGMPRSGTTLIEQILASHSEVYGAGERSEFTFIAPRHVPPDPVRWHDVPAQALDALDTEYMSRLRPLAPDATCIVDKMPNNGIYAGLILMAIPDAKVIWVERDLMDCCFSCYNQIFAGNLPYTYDQAELGRYARTFNDMMAHWETVLPPDRFLHLRYEDLLATPEEKMRQLIAFCGLEWQEQCLHFEKTKRVVVTASVTQVRQPLNKNTGGRWKPYEKGLARLKAALNGAENQDRT